MLSHLLINLSQEFPNRSCLCLSRIQIFFHPTSNSHKLLAPTASHGRMPCHTEQYVVFNLPSVNLIGISSSCIRQRTINSHLLSQSHLGFYRSPLNSPLIISFAGGRPTLPKRAVRAVGWAEAECIGPITMWIHAVKAKRKNSHWQMSRVIAGKKSYVRIFKCKNEDLFLLLFLTRNSK